MSSPSLSTSAATREITIAQAINEALAEELRRDDTVFLIGEDVAEAGHPFKVLAGLVEEFGSERVLDSPISEPGITGLGVGAAMTGLRPVVDIMFGDFLTLVMDQLANQAAKLRYMSGGQVELPIVYFTGTGPSGSAAAQHSENPHPMIMNVAGLKVVMPSTPFDAKGLMIAAIRDNSPVVYFQDAVLGGKRGPVPEGPYEVPIGIGDVKREGTDVTIVAIGATVPIALKAAATLEADGISAEVVDPRTLVPMDHDLILGSVAKTGRLVVCDSARLTCSAASEIAATVAERGFDLLKAAPLRVAWEDVPIPFSPVLEQRVLVNEDRVLEAARRTIEGAKVGT